MTRGRKARMVLGAAVAALVLAATPAGAQVTPPPTNGFVFDGVVASTLKLGSFTYVGGDFDAQVRPIAGNAVLATAGGAGTLVAGGAPPVTGGSVDVTVDDGAGGLYVGGRFTAVGSVARRNLAHIRADGTVDPTWDPSPDGRVVEIDRVGDRVFVLGTYGSVGGRSFGAPAAGRVAALDAVTGRATAFTPAITAVQGFDAVGGLVYVAGAYQGGPARALDAVTGAATAWRPAEAGSEASSVVVSGTTVVLGVTIRAYDLIELAGFDSTSGANAWRAPDGFAYLDLVAAAGGRIYFTGTWPRSDNGGVGYQPLAVRALDANTGEQVWSAQDGLSHLGSDGAVCGVLVRGSAVYVTGRFRRLQDGGADRHGAAAFDVATGAVLPWDPYLNGTTCGIGALGGGIYLSGDFTAGGTPVASVHDLARLKADGSIDATFSPGALRPELGYYLTALKSISSMRFAGGKLYVAGGFRSFGGLPRSSLAAVDLSTGAIDRAFAPAGIVGAEITDIYPDRVRVVSNLEASEFTRATGARIPRRTTLENDLETMLERLDPTAGASIRGVLSPTPYPGGGVGIVLRVGDVIVGSGVATVPGESDVEVPVALNDVGRLILSVYPRFVFGGVAVYAFADGEEPVWAQAQVQAPAG